MADYGKLAVTLNGVQHEVTLKPGDFIAFERKFGITFEADVTPKVEHVFFLGWNASRRAGLTTDDFDAWIDQVDDLEPIDEVPLDPSVSS